jgi:hypothetical protein
MHRFKIKRGNFIFIQASIYYMNYGLNQLVEVLYIFCFKKDVKHPV